MQFWCLLVISCVVRVCVCDNVLVVFPVPSDTHTTLDDSLVNTLLNAGYETYISPRSTIEPHVSLTYIDIGSTADENYDDDTLSGVEQVRQSRPLQRALELGAAVARRALHHRAVRAVLNDPDRTFQLVLADWFYSGLLAPLASVYECPLVWYSAEDESWMTMQLVHGASNPAHSVGPRALRPATGHALTDRLQRLREQVLDTAYMNYMLYYVENSDYEEVYRTPLQLRARPPPRYEDLVYNASLLLANSQPLLGQPLALPPNAKYVGGHHIEVPSKPLPENLQQIMDDSKNGVIYFSLESDVKSKVLPEYMKMQLIDVFGQLEQTVIWKLEEPLEDLPKNLHVVEWVPQLNILNHTNTILFISDGGFTSYLEAMYFGVPILGIPMSGDQFLTAELARARGHGTRVRFSDYLPYRQKDAILQVISNPRQGSRYRYNAKKASAILQNSLVPPQKELLYWIELVLHHGADHLRSPAVLLSTVERLYLDVAALTIIFLWFLYKVWKVVKVHWDSGADTVKKDQ